MTARFPQMISILRQAVKHEKTECVVWGNKLCVAVLRKLRERKYILGFHFTPSGYRGSPKITILLNPQANRVLRLARLYPKTHSNFHAVSNRKLYLLRNKNILVTTSWGLKWTNEYAIGHRKLPGGVLLLRII